MNPVNLDLYIENPSADVWTVRVRADNYSDARSGFTLAPAQRLFQHPPRTNADARALGLYLFQALFTPPIAGVYQGLRETAERTNTFLRLRLNLDAAASLLPWEYLYDPAASNFLARNPNFSVVRYPSFGRVLGSLRIPPPLRILALAVQPRDEPLLNLKAERANLESGLAELVQANKVEIEWLEPQTPDALRRAIALDRAHILHFLGHGRQHTFLDESGLILLRPDGYGTFFPSSELAQLTAGSNALKLVILNACETGTLDANHAYSSVAGHLLRNGEVSAVVAMQTGISDDASVAFTQGFYQALARGNLLDQAVTEGRRAIFTTTQDAGWGTPALYLHANDEPLVQVVDDESLPPLDAIPDVPLHFVGRTKELELYRTALKARNLALIEGMAGIGKTTLGAVLAREQLGEGYAVFWIGFNTVNRNNGENFIWELAAFFQRHGKPELWDALQLETEASASNFARRFTLIIKAVETGNFTLCFDDLHLVVDDPIISQLFWGLRSKYPGTPERLPARFIVMTRQVPDYMRYLSGEPLAGLSDKAMREWVAAERLELTQSQTQQLLNKVHGNPQFLTLALAGLIRSMGNPAATERTIHELQEQRSVRDYLMNEIYRSLSEPERQVLDILSVFDAFVSRDVLKDVSVGEVQQLTLHLENLLERNVVTERHDSGEVGLHALVRDWCYEGLDKDKQQRLDEKAGRNFEGRGEFVVAAHHYLRADKTVRAAELLTKNSSDLIRRGQADGMLRVLDALRRDQCSADLWIAILLARGEAHSWSGAHALATTAFQDALPLLAESPDAVRLQERIGRSLNAQGEFEQALPFLASALEKGTMLAVPLLVANAELGLAYAYSRLNNATQAIEHSEKAITIARTLNDSLLQARAQFERAIAALDSSDTAYAISLLTAALAIFQAHHRTDLTANALLELGLAYHNLDDFDQAETKYLAACALYEQIGDFSNLASVLNNLADLELGRDRPPAALPYLERAQLLAQGRQDSYLQALIDYTYASAWVALGDQKQAQQVIAQGLELSAQKQYIVLQSGFWVLAGELNGSGGDVSAATTAFEQAIALLTVNQIDSKFEWSVLYTKYGEFLCAHAQANARGCEYLGKAVALAREMGAHKRTFELENLIQKYCVP